MKRYFVIIMVLIMPYTSAAQTAISNVVIPVSYFVDHVKQLTLVKNNLNKYRQTSLVGISGMGKTQLARMYAYENKSNYDLIWFIDCNLDINEEFLKLAKSINEKTKTNLISEDVGSAKKEVLSYLSSKDKWLLVFDNLKIKENHKIQEFINWEHNGHVIFASQDGELLPNTVKMTAFEKNDATTLVNNILEKGDSKLADFLVQEFVGYPVLIVQGAQLLNQVPGLDQEEYKRKIQQSTDKVKLNVILATNELKSSTRVLLNKIALMNNQAFSKDLLRIITNDESTLDDDIYQLSKFALIANIDPNGNNPVFEMHDVIAQKIMEINGDNNKNYLEDIVTKLMYGIPKNVLKGRIFRNTKTIRENMAIILNNAQKYNINMYKVMELRFHVLNSYLNIFDYYNAEELVEWFNKNDKEGKLKLLFMNNNEKRIYAGYLGLIAAYYKSKYSDYNLTLEYYKKAQEVFKGIKGSNSYRYNILYNLASTYTILGQIQKAQENIQIIEKMFSDGLVDESELFYIYIAKAKLFFTLGEYTKALEQINGAVNVFLSNKLHKDNLLFTNSYILRAEILNALSQYKEAHAQVEQLYDMHKPSKKGNHEVFGRIFTKMSIAELGLGNIRKALEYAQKAITIFINDLSRLNQHLATSPDIELAKAFFAEGDALTALGQNENAVHSYLKAEMLYWNNYKDNLRNVDEVSRMYISAAKASCHLSEKAWYIKFHDQHISKFGADHPRSVEILKMDSVCYPESQR